MPRAQNPWTACAVTCLTVAIGPMLSLRFAAFPVMAFQTGAICRNGLFESGIPAGWTASTGGYLADKNDNNAPGNLQLSPSSFISGRQTITPSWDWKSDPVVPGLPLMNEGSYSMRLGRNAQSASPYAGEAESVSYTFIASTPAFRFSYAVVLEDAGHPSNQAPFFLYLVCVPDCSKPQNIQNSFSIIANAGNPYMKSLPYTDPGGQKTTVRYKPWDCESIDLTPFQGKKVTIQFITSHCSYGPHFGYAYIDGFCDESVVPSFTIPATTCNLSGRSPSIPADGSASRNATDYFWSVEESDSNGGRVPATERGRWFNAAQPGPIDIGSFYSSQGGELKCNTYYRVKLAIKNTCVPWRELVKLVYVSCVQSDPGPAHQICCGIPNGPITLGPKSPDPTSLYSWTSTPTGFTSNSANPTVLPGGDTTYNLTLKNAFGCSASGSVAVSCARKGQVNIDISTGVLNGVKSPFQAVDLNWRLVSNTTGAVDLSVYSVKPYVAANSWATSGNVATWIAPAVNADGTPPDVPGTTSSLYVYRRYAYLDPAQFASLDLELRLDEYAADDSMDLIVNGKSTAGNGCGSLTLAGMASNFNTMHGPCVLKKSWLVPGWNTIDVAVQNMGLNGAKSRSGIWLYGRISATCAEFAP